MQLEVKKYLYDMQRAEAAEYDMARELKSARRDDVLPR